MDAALALMTFLTESDHKHLVLGNSLPIQVDYVVVMLDRRATHAERMLKVERIPVTALRGVHAALTRLYAR
jgi:hypothetical protein